uniref:Uncharacterized protein n=1 Tax=Meloidogyne enterolobii TaxID=390850 RepID=A0A6V7VBG5_MELEN|nr:unnamed protein product [Meloidogyne enterolobii]
MKKHRLMDYNNEIPFEKQVTAGFHDLSEDRFDKNEDLPESIFGENHEKKRSKLILPEPQISDKELEDIIKIGHVSDSVRELVDDSHIERKEDSPTTLLHDYNESARINAFSARTQRAAVEDVDTTVAKADDLIKSEMYSLIEWNVEGKEPPPKQIYSKEAMELAKKMIDIEATKMAEAEDIELKLDSQMWQSISVSFRMTHATKMQKLG